MTLICNRFNVQVAILACIENMMGKDRIAVLLILMQMDSLSSVQLAMPSRHTSVIQTERLLVNDTLTRKKILQNLFLVSVVSYISETSETS